MNTITSDNMIILMWVVVMVVILLSINSKCEKNGEKTGSVEGFYTYPGYYKKYCGSCGWRSRYNCGKCTNCGYAINASGYGNCVPGDSSGPYFQDDALYWEYGDSNDYYPYSHVYPSVKTYDSYPYYRWNLRKGRWGYRKRNITGKLASQRAARDNRDLRRRLQHSQQ